MRVRGDGNQTTKAKEVWFSLYPPDQTMPHTGERSEIEQLSTGPAMQWEVSGRSDAALPTTEKTVEETTMPEPGQLSLPTGQADSSDDAARAVGSILTHGSIPRRLEARGVELPWAPNATCFTIENVLSDDECEQLIALSERRGYEQALVNVGNGRQAMSDVRRSSRWMVDSESAADELWRRIERHVPDVVAKSRSGKGTTVGWYASGLNERLRFLKYNPGDYFAPHQDGSFRAEPCEVSHDGDALPEQCGQGRRDQVPQPARRERQRDRRRCPTPRPLPGIRPLAAARGSAAAEGRQVCGAYGRHV